MLGLAGATLTLKKIRLKTKTGIRTYYVREDYPLRKTKIEGVFVKGRKRASKSRARARVSDKEKKLREYEAALERREKALRMAESFEKQKGRNFNIQDREVVPISKLQESDFAKYVTWFRASGGFDNAGFWKRGETPPGLDEYESDEFEGGYPRRWDSTTIGTTYDPIERRMVKLNGVAVKYKGIRKLEDLLAKVNRALQQGGKRDPAFDFRKVYPYWKFNYEVLEYVGSTLVGRYGISDQSNKRR